MKDLEIRARLEKLSDWILNRGRLEKTYLFPNFARAAIFFNKLVNPIEEQAHYPVIVIAYNRVSVSLSTNEEGSITEKDFVLATAFDALI